MQLIGRGAVTIIDDAYNSNPVGSKAAVETLGLFDGIKILVTPGMVELGDKEEEYNKAFGGYAAAMPRRTAITSALWGGSARSRLRQARERRDSRRSGLRYSTGCRRRLITHMQ